MFRMGTSVPPVAEYFQEIFGNPFGGSDFKCFRASGAIECNHARSSVQVTKHLVSA